MELRQDPTLAIGLLLGNELKVDGSTIALLRFFNLIEKPLPTLAIISPPG